jgi:hypothetical protein
MGKGTGHLGFKHSSYQFKKRCQYIGCKKRAKYFIEGKYYCKNHAN